MSVQTDIACADEKCYLLADLYPSGALNCFNFETETRNNLIVFPTVNTLKKDAR